MSGGVKEVSAEYRSIQQVDDCPVGYKRTEVGVVPEDWEVVSILNLTDVDPENLNASTNKDYEFDYISLELVDRGRLKGTDKYIYSEAPSRARRVVKKGDVLVATVRPNLMSHYKITSKVKDLVCSTGFSVLRPKKNVCDSSFLFFNFFAGVINRQIDTLISGSNYPAISSSDVKCLRLPVPSTIEEQTAIANALSDVDTLITSLEKLITKKRAIKTAAMQQLLTGKKRLPPFDKTHTGYKQTELGEIPEDWEVGHLPKFIWYQEGPGLRNWQFTKKGIKVINVTNLQYSGVLNLDKTDRHISIEEFDKIYRHFECDAGDFVMASSGNSYCKSSLVRESDLPLLMNTSVIRFKSLSGMNNGYMQIYLKSEYFKEQIDLLITGGAQPNFGPFHLNKIILPIPSSEEEQKTISDVLIGMEQEIEASEKRLTKTQQLKQGMMQELLTGRIRLTVAKGG